jgi:hypothetical protein
MDRAMLSGAADRAYDRDIMRTLAAVVLLGVVLAGCGGGSKHGPPTLRHGDGITYLLPAGWHVASRTLTPHLVNPRELFVAGTGRLASGASGCAQMPSAALGAMRAQDVLVTVQERFGSVREFGTRPQHFSLSSGFAPSEADRCTGAPPPFASHLAEFRSGGRGFEVLVAVGRSAPRARVNEALGLLDSLRIAPRRASRLSPNDSTEDQVNGVQVVHPSAWRLYREALTQAIGAREQLALGTFRLHQRAPDANCTPATALRLRPSGGGFLFVYENVGLNRTEFTRIPPRPARLRLAGPQPFECFGSSWRVDFRQGGRAFTAHVYGSLARRREALAILDSLRIRPAPFDTSSSAAVFTGAPGFRTRVSRRQHDRCLVRRTSWASTVPFTNGPNDLPPHSMIAALPPDGIIMAIVQWRECRALRGVRALQPPLALSRAVRMGFEGPRGDELPLYRIMGRFAGRYYFDVWVFFGRHRPTPAQFARAARELSSVRWPAWL